MGKTEGNITVLLSEGLQSKLEEIQFFLAREEIPKNPCKL